MWRDTVLDVHWPTLCSCLQNSNFGEAVRLAALVIFVCMLGRLALCSPNLLTQKVATGERRNQRDGGHLVYYLRSTLKNL